MGWDIYVAVRTRQQTTPLSRLRMVHRSIHAFFSVCVRDEDHLRPPIAEIDAQDGDTLDPAVLEDLAARYRGGEPAAEGWMSVQRFRSGPHAVPEAFAYRAVWHCLSEGYRWPALSGHDADVVYDAGDYKHYLATLRGESAVRNFTLLIQECAGLLALGVRSMRGLDAERSLDPGDAYLVFHDDVAGYALDLRRMGLDHGVLTPEKVVDAALLCDSVTLEETAQGPIVYAKQGVEGRLRSFYEALAN